eukprot:CAMPEP_0177684604 /NCGR_PEP_ID=MMETSP0447-20121125/32527_1 /TAXON_ID=0 /ORGANISM="Stygamoeba regulata, Strain BSH-02190019" /LENGTH=95 /DNA_ID=CAMNT_0019194477 /DNA_START=242 /DNA_END=529 /DNA_ORIENTATION=-
MRRRSVLSLLNGDICSFLRHQTSMCNSNAFTTFTDWQDTHALFCPQRFNGLQRLISLTQAEDCIKPARSRHASSYNTINAAGSVDKLLLLRRLYD